MFSYYTNLLDELLLLQEERADLLDVVVLPLPHLLDVLRGLGVLPPHLLQLDRQRPLLLLQFLQELWAMGLERVTSFTTQHKFILLTLHYRLPTVTKASICTCNSNIREFLLLFVQ